MKIDSDLRHAIRAALKNKPTDWQAIARDKETAVKTLLAKKPAVRAAVKRMTALRDQAEKIRTQLHAIEKKTGISFEYGSKGKLQIAAEADFLRAGGLLPVTRKLPSFEAAMGEIAAAPDQRTLNAILKRLNIVWK